MDDLLKAWSKITHLSFQGESHFAETDEESGQTLTAPEPSRFECCFADLDLVNGRWECSPEGETRRWTWLPFPKPIRYWVNYHPQVRRWINGSAPFHASMTKETCDGKTVTTVRFRGNKEDADPRWNIYTLDDFKSGRRLDKRILGLSCLPPFISVSHYNIVSEISRQRPPPKQQSTDSNIISYTLWFPESLLEVTAAWYSRYNWFTSIQSKRWGIPSTLLDKLRHNPNLNQEDRERLKNEREVVETSHYEASDFAENGNGEICFPQHMIYTSDFGKRHEQWSWKVENWNTAPKLSDRLFQTEIPEGVRVNDARKPSI